MLMSDVAVSLATWNDFLGVHEVISPCKVLMMSGESGLPTLAKNFRTIHKSIAGRFGKLPRSMPGDILLSDQVPRINERKHLDAMKALFDDKQPDVLIIDTASLAMPGKDAANLIVQQELLAPMTALCCERGITFVLIHHMHARANPHDPPQLDDVAYAGYKEWARQWILLSRQQPYTPPEHDGDRIHHLWLSAGGSAGHSQLTGLTINEGTQHRPKWIVEVTTTAKSKAACQKQQADTHLTSDREIVLDALSRMPDGETKNTIRDATKLNMPRITLAINSLLESGGVERCLVERSNKQKYDGYRLPLVQNDSYNQ